MPNFGLNASSARSSKRISLAVTVATRGLVEVHPSVFDQWSYRAPTVTSVLLPRRIRSSPNTASRFCPPPDRTIDVGSPLVNAHSKLSPSTQRASAPATRRLRPATLDHNRLVPACAAGTV